MAPNEPLKSLPCSMCSNVQRSVAQALLSAHPSHQVVDLGDDAFFD
jgi:hypothetical protein